LKTLQIIDGDFVRTKDRTSWIELDDIDVVTQRLNHRLMLWQREWFLDRSEGTDWMGILDKPFSLRRMHAEILRVINKDEDVNKIESLIIEPDFGKRVLKINILVLAKAGNINITREISD
jgi:hypothetical protein